MDALFKRIDALPADLIQKLEKDWGIVKYGNQYIVKQSNLILPSTHTPIYNTPTVANLVEVKTLIYYIKRILPYLPHPSP